MMWVMARNGSKSIAGWSTNGSETSVDTENRETFLAYETVLPDEPPSRIDAVITQPAAHEISRDAKRWSTNAYEDH
jgi:hypothetical protein